MGADLIRGGCYDDILIGGYFVRGYFVSDILSADILFADIYAVPDNFMTRINLPNHDFMCDPT